MKKKEKRPSKFNELRALEKQYEEQQNNKEYRNVLFKQQDIMNERKSYALSLLIVGIIIAIIGSVTLLLSFKYNTQRQRVFRPKSFEFIFTCIAYACALSSIIYGIYSLIYSAVQKKSIKKKLDASKPVK